MRRSPLLSAFNSEVKRLQRSRAARLPGHQDFEYLRDEAARRIVERLDDLQQKHRSMKRIVAHCGGSSAELPKLLLEKHPVEHVYFVDDCEEHLDNLRGAMKQVDVRGASIEYVLYDHLQEVTNAVPKKSVDLFVAPLIAHWMTDLHELFTTAAAVLKPDSPTIGAMFGSSTLWELRNSFLLAEQERSGGVSPHISPFAGPDDLGSAIGKAGLKIPTIDVDDIEIRYANPFLLMHELGRMGENNAAQIRRTDKVPRQEVYAAAALYHSLYAYPEEDGGGVPASFSLMHWIAWTPDPSQAKPLARGSAKHSLKDLGEVEKWRPKK